jgi:Carboxypeptidase regulatory-like domain
VNRARVSRFALALLLVLSTALAMSAQVQSRFLSGKVLDNGDQGIPKAIVYLKNTKTLVIKTYIADPDGAYHFPGLSQSADYEVYAESNGKRSDVKTVSSYDTRNRVNINLHIDR